ncbi:MAG: hypothetical protein HFI16_09545 [Lachnospiraceae bacterium]|nr:hypothetical protein [Lachnospiraceae bacterium]
MSTYEELLIEADNHNLITKEKPLRASKGRIKGNRIAIQKGLMEVEKKCVLAEELGHFYTASGNILDQSSVSSRKQELRGRVMAYDRLVGLLGIIKAYQRRCRNLSEMAEYLEIPEDFLKDALAYYRNKYGVFTQVDHYLIIFEPSLVVMDLL